MAQYFKRQTLSLRLRVIFSIILLLVIIGGTFSFLTVRSIHELIEDVLWSNYSSYARSFAEFSAKSFAEGDLVELQRHLNIAYTEKDMLFVAATDFKGNIIAKSGNLEDYQPFEIHKNIFDDNFIQVQEIGIKPGGLFHASGHTFLITSKVQYEQREVGLIQLALNTASANQRLADISFWGFKMAFGMVVIGTFILIFVDRRLRKNIVRLIQITRSMAEGDLSQRVTIKTGDEIEHLGESFNMMAQALKQHEEEIITTRKKYENLFEESIIPTCVLDTDGNVLEVNKAGENLIGVTKEDLRQQPFKKLAKQPQLFEQFFQKLISEGAHIKNFEHEIINGSGQTIIVENNAGPILDEQGSVLSIITTFKDITQQKKLERQVQQYTEQLEKLVEQRTRELENEKNKLQLILDNVPNAFLMLNEKLQVESVSSQFEAVLNKKRKDVLGKTCALSELLYEASEQCPARKALETGQVQLQQAVITTPLNAEKYLEHMAIPIQHQGKTEKILEIITDITGRKRIEEQLIRTEKLSATGEMAAIIAHEMRNSLSSVNLILQWMTDTIKPGEEESKSLEVAIASVNRMELIVRQLLEFAKPSDISFQMANINDLVEQSMVFCKYQIQRKQIQLQKNLSSDLPSIEMDIEMTRELLINILLNATDAVKEKGHIAIHTEMVTLEHALKDRNEHKSILLKKGERVIKIRIADDGAGIAKKNLHRIYDPFYTNKTKGTGLGLTMAKRAVVEHGGILFAESSPGMGSTFTIILPLTQRSIR